MDKTNGISTCFLGDFGVGTMFGKTLDLASTQIGTLNFMSPEVYKNEKYTFSTDIFGLGCLLYQLCSFELAFNGKDRDEIKNATLNTQPPRIPDLYTD